MLFYYYSQFKYIFYCYCIMHKSAIFGLFLMASLLLGTSVNMNMFASANAQGMGQYDNSYQSTYGNDPYGSSYDHKLRL